MKRKKKTKKELLELAGPYLLVAAKVSLEYIERDIAEKTRDDLNLISESQIKVISMLIGAITLAEEGDTICCEK